MAGQYSHNSGKAVYVLANGVTFHHVGTRTYFSGLTYHLICFAGSIGKKCMKGHVVLLNCLFHVQAHGFKQGLEGGVGGTVPFKFGSWRKIWNGCQYLLCAEPEQESTENSGPSTAWG